MRTILVALLAGASVVQAQQIKPQTRDLRPPATQAREAADRTGVIAGIVVSAETGNAVRRARVTLVGGTPRMSKSFETDERGSFRFANLPSGDFTLGASKPGYVDSTFGEKVPGSGRPGTPIHLNDKQEIARLSLPLSRGAVITGAVYDETGEPAFGESIELLRWTMTSGERTLEYVATANTDDRGLYRFPALSNGEYLVCTVGSILAGDYDFGTFLKFSKLENAVFETKALKGSISIVVDGKDDDAMDAAVPRTAFGPVYFPGTTDYSEAQTVTVTVGEERSGVDFRLRPVPIGRIVGAVTGPNGPVSGVEVKLINRGQPPGLHVRTIRAGKDGRFEFPDVTPGQYTVLANATPKSVKAAVAEEIEVDARLADEKKRALLASAVSSSFNLWAMAEVSSNGDGVSEVALTLQPGITLSGHVSAEGDGASPSLARLMLTAEPVGQHMSGQNAAPAPAVVDASGNFTIRGLMPGRYRLAIASGAPNGYRLRSAIVSGQDVLDVPLQVKGDEPPLLGVVTLSNRTTTIEGSVQTSAGQPASDITVIAFSADSRFWAPLSRRIQAMRPSTDGKYSFRNLPAGDYRLIAVTDIEPGRWFDPAVLRTLAGFINVTLPENGRVTQDMRIR